MRTGDLFLHTWEDLRRRSVAPLSDFDLLGVSRIVRQLLLEENPLAHQVNREHRLKLIFTILPNELDRPWPTGVPYPDMHLVPGLSPNRWPEIQRAPKDLKIDRFLQYIVLRVGADSFSIHDVVDYVAHVMGGVHHRQERTDRERLLASLGERLSDLLGSHPMLLFMRDLADVVTEALAPLYQAERA